MKRMLEVQREMMNVVVERALILGAKRRLLNRRPLASVLRRVRRMVLIPRMVVSVGE